MRKPEGDEDATREDSNGKIKTGLYGCSIFEREERRDRERERQKGRRSRGDKRRIIKLDEKGGANRKKIDEIVGGKG